MKKKAVTRSAIQSSTIREEEIQQEKIRAAQEDEARRKKKEEAAEDGAASEADNKSAAGAKTSRSIPASKSSVRDASQITADDFVHERSNVDDDFKGVLMALWKEISTTYKSQMMKVLHK